MSCKTEKIHPTAQPHVWQGSLGRVWVVIIPSLARAAQARAPLFVLCGPGKAETESYPLPPGRSILSHSALFFLTTFFSPLPSKFSSLDQQFQCHLFKCHLWSPPSPPLPFPRSFLHTSQKTPTKSASPPHPSLLIWSSASALAGTGSEEATPGSRGLEQVTRCSSWGARALGGSWKPRVLPRTGCPVKTLRAGLPTKMKARAVQKTPANICICGHQLCMCV